MSPAAPDSPLRHWHADPGAACALCRDAGGLQVAGAARWRVVRVEDDAFPAFYRVIWNSHAAEFTDLAPDARDECMAAVAAVERVLRERLRPDKVNLASFGNMVAHLHWHVVARFAWDSHWPQPVWGTSQREPPADAAARLGVSLDDLDAAVRAALAPLAGALSNRL